MYMYNMQLQMRMITMTMVMRTAHLEIMCVNKPKLKSAQLHLSVGPFDKEQANSNKVASHV